MEKEKSVENNEVVDKDVIGLSKLDMVEPIELVDKKEEMKDRTNNESYESTNEELTEWETKAEVVVETPRTYVPYSTTILRKVIQDKEYGGIFVIPCTIGIAEDVLALEDGYSTPEDFVILVLRRLHASLFI
ncbi:hypothetical protein Tco_0901406 [Tanacetum coccineum]